MLNSSRVLGATRARGLALEKLYTSASVEGVANMAVNHPEVFVTDVQNVAHVHVNRPKALNALNLSMIHSLTEAYTSRDAVDDPTHCFVLSGTGGKAFCAGGDVKYVVLESKAGRAHDAIRFFYDEYHLNHLLSSLEKPHVAVLDGIVMGGGCGISMHGPFRVATKNTLFAMPECAIGLHPDVGGSFFLNHLPGSMGKYLALTGARLRGHDVKVAGLATHFCSPEDAARVPEALAALGAGARDLSRVNAALAALESQPCEPSAPHESLADKIPVINKCFAHWDMGEIFAALESEAATNSAATEFCTSARDMMAAASPLSLRVTLEMMSRTRHLPLTECLTLEHRVTSRMCEGAFDGTSDFYEGVRAMLIERGTKPAWRHVSVEEVTDSDVAHFFEPLPTGGQGEDPWGCDLRFPQR